MSTIVHRPWFPGLWSFTVDAHSELDAWARNGARISYLGRERDPSVLLAATLIQSHSMRGSTSAVVAQEQAEWSESEG